MRTKSPFSSFKALFLSRSSPSREKRGIFDDDDERIGVATRFTRCAAKSLMTTVAIVL